MVGTIKLNEGINENLIIIINQFNKRPFCYFVNNFNKAILFSIYNNRSRWIRFPDWSEKLEHDAIFIKLMANMRAVLPDLKPHTPGPFKFSIPYLGCTLNQHHISSTPPALYLSPPLSHTLLRTSALLFFIIKFY
jgi:hypothetical protein